MADQPQQPPWEPSSLQSCHALRERRMAATRSTSFRTQSVSSATTGWRAAQRWNGSSRPWRDLFGVRSSLAQQGRQTPLPSPGSLRAGTFGDHRGLSALLTSFHDRRQGMGESVVGYAQHLLMLTTKLNAVQADAVNPAMLCDCFIDGLHPPAREHEDVIFHQARTEAQRWMLMWRCEQSRSWWFNPNTTRKWRSCGPK